MCLGEQGDGESLPNILQHSTLQREGKKKNGAGGRMSDLFFCSLMIYKNVTCKREGN